LSSTEPPSGPVDPQADAPTSTELAPDAPEAPPAPPPAPADDPHRALLDALSTELGDGLVESHEQRDDLWVRVRAQSWKRTAEVLRRQLGFDYFCFLSGIDWMPHTWPNPKVEDEAAEDEAGDETEEAEEGEPQAAPQSDQAAPDGRETSYAGADSRFQVVARVYNTNTHIGVTLKADLDEAAPTVATWSDVYAGANWHERETWEMYGFDFVGHPNLIHLYLPSEFEGFPLRKDFPLLAREVKPWPGLVDVEQFPPGTEGDGSSTNGDGEGDDS
jgi:NADH-quinone oxidoreductase subunit C